MDKTGADVDEFLSKVTPAGRKRDAAALVALMREATGREPEMWGPIVGFGSCRYRYGTGTQGDSPVVSFGPRKQATTVYLLDGVGAHADDLAKLGPHSTGVGCLYLKDLAAVDTDVLRSIIADSDRRVRRGDVEGVTITVTD